MDDAQRREALLLQGQGLSKAEIARQIRVPRSTLHAFLSYHHPLRAEDPKRPTQAEIPPSKGPTKGDVDQMELASLRSKVKQMEQVRPNVIPAYSPLPTSTPEARWKAAEIDNAEHIRKAMLMAEFSVELPGEPCAIVAISDQHISLGNTVDLERMREDAELVAETDGCYAILGGDFVDNHCKHRSAILGARSTPSDQFELCEYYLGIFAHRILVACLGNHDLFTAQMAGVDVMGMLLKQQKTCYAPDEAQLTIRVGNQPYKIGIRHQYRMNSSFNECHAPKQWFRNGECSWDIGIVGHHHVSSVEPFWGHGVERWACRPGSYQITSAYSRQYGFNKTQPMCPTFVLSPKKREIIGFHDLRPALRFLKAERG